MQPGARFFVSGGYCGTMFDQNAIFGEFNNQLLGFMKEVAELAGDIHLEGRLPEADIQKFALMAAMPGTASMPAQWVAGNLGSFVTDLLAAAEPDAKAEDTDALIGRMVEHLSGNEGVPELEKAFKMVAGVYNQLPDEKQAIVEHLAVLVPAAMGAQLLAEGGMDVIRDLLGENAP